MIVTERPSKIINHDIAQSIARSSINTPMNQASKQYDSSNGNGQRDKVLLSGIERLINRKIEVGVHMIKQLTCKNENVNKMDTPA